MYSCISTKNIFIFLISLILIRLFYLIFVDEVKIKISNDLIQDDFQDLINNNIQILVVTGFYQDKNCDKFINNINNINKSGIIPKKWSLGGGKYFDVNIYQKPLSDYFNNLCSLDEYIKQDDIISEFISGIDHPFKNLVKNIKNYKIKVGCDPVLGFGIEKKYQDFLVRVYEKSNIFGEGLKHVDTDDTGLYNKYKLFSMNIYLNNFDGGELKYWKNIFKKIMYKPMKGDLIIINPCYYHSVLPVQSRRISVQSFLLVCGDNIYIRN